MWSHRPHVYRIHRCGAAVCSESGAASASPCREQNIYLENLNTTSHGGNWCEANINCIHDFLVF